MSTFSEQPPEADATNASEVAVRIRGGADAAEVAAVLAVVLTEDTAEAEPVPGQPPWLRAARLEGTGARAAAAPSDLAGPLP